MMKVYDLFRGDAKPDDVLARPVRAGDATDGERKQRLFLAHLYLGLYFDATGDKKQAPQHRRGRSQVVCGRLHGGRRPRPRGLAPQGQGGEAE